MAEPARGHRLGRQIQDTEQLVLMLGAATVPLGHPDALPLRLLQDHLGVGMSSRLFVVMREERGLAYDVGVHMPTRCGPAPRRFRPLPRGFRPREPSFDSTHFESEECSNMRVIPGESWDRVTISNTPPVVPARNL